MANPPRFRSITRPAESMIKALEERTGITGTAGDSMAKVMTDSVAQEIVQQNNQMVEALESTQISQARGRNLDELAASHGIRRLDPRQAFSESTERSFYFYVPTGTFGDLNGGAPIPLPVGTEIYPDSSEENQILYQTTEEYVLDPASSLEYCSVQAVSFGSTQNVGPRMLNSHALSSQFPNLYCTNRYAIVTGRTRENDDQLRFRLSNLFTTLASNNKSALLMQALTVPGVLDVSIVEGYYGMGTCAVFVFGADGFSSPDLINAVRTRVGQVSTAGQRVIVVPGVQTSFSFEMDIVLDSQPTNTQRSSIEAGIGRSIRAYLSNGNRRRTVNLKQIRDRIVRDNSNIVSILPRSSLREDTLFKNVYIVRKYATYSTPSTRETMINKYYTLDSEEYAVLGYLDINFRVV